VAAPASIPWAFHCTAAWTTASACRTSPRVLLHRLLAGSHSRDRASRSSRSGRCRPCTSIAARDRRDQPAHDVTPQKSVAHCDGNAHVYCTYFLCHGLPSIQSCGYSESIRISRTAVTVRPTRRAMTLSGRSRARPVPSASTKARDSRALGSAPVQVIARWATLLNLLQRRGWPRVISARPRIVLYVVRRGPLGSHCLTPKKRFAPFHTACVLTPNQLL